MIKFPKQYPGQSRCHLAALNGAVVACVRAGAANGRGQGGAPAHDAGADPAELCAVAAGANALGHFRVPDICVAPTL